MKSRQGMGFSRKCSNKGVRVSEQKVEPVDEEQGGVSNPSRRVIATMLCI
jgi:hypothetical protein